MLITLIKNKFCKTKKPKTENQPVFVQIGLSACKLEPILLTDRNIEPTPIR